ncbi:Polysaccharide pyruvyl transferase [Butyrivibrio fibrisolvens DSM 3071]|uniref:Polysaccharide pyruvyl transferase n=1 Tax=Butyrivibrio fibrisolvens DSM 3071 TaxID=1121131 RepID=A0A1M5Z7M3_BUTFI|nr:polysaccharide pyruvyl transferase family protein [Butyrivibrio fibrisolvens]SHI20236.1 Polysaccharide pyruvyl transferase [Butyrivibrio fibrisolvens DSM 3071]
MKVGILTFHRTSNFGSFFQTYALYYYLDKLGVDCYIIDYCCKEIEKREKMSIFNSHTLREMVHCFFYSRSYRRRYNSLSKQIHEKTRCSKQFNQNNIKEANKEFDCFLVGSDLVWSFEITGNDKSYYLDFATDDKLKCSYASSFGKTISENEKDAIRQYLQRFYAVSVREKQSISEINSIIQSKKVISVCDPTMLLAKEWNLIYGLHGDNNKLIHKGEKYILLYFPDISGKMIKDAYYLKDKYGYKIICINEKRPHRNIKNVSIDGPDDFLHLFQHAQIVLTGSYHGILFSIYNRIPFFYYVRSHSLRMENLSSILDIEDRRGEYIRNISNPEVIDYEKIYNNLNIMVSQSKRYLNEIAEKMLEV